MSRLPFTNKPTLLYTEAENYAYIEPEVVHKVRGEWVLHCWTEDKQLFVQILHIKYMYSQLSCFCLKIKLCRPSTDPLQIVVHVFKICLSPMTLSWRYLLPVMTFAISHIKCEWCFKLCFAPYLSHGIHLNCGRTIVLFGAVRLLQTFAP